MAEKLSGYIGRIINPERSSRFLTGNGLYVADIRLPDMLHAAFVRSSHAHAKIRAIDIAEALHLEGVVGVWSGADIESRISRFPESFEIHPARWLDGVRPLLQGPRPSVLATQKVRSEE